MYATGSADVARTVTLVATTIVVNCMRYDARLVPMVTAPRKFVETASTTVARVVWTVVVLDVVTAPAHAFATVPATTMAAAAVMVAVVVVVVAAAAVTSSRGYFLTSLSGRIV